MSSIKPSPLKLRHDNTRPVLSSPRLSIRRRIVNRLYETDLRHLLLFLGFINSMRYFAIAKAAFDDADVDAAEQFPELWRVSWAIAVVFTLACLCEILGIFTNVFLSLLHESRRLPATRLHLFVAFLSMGLVMTAGGMAIVNNVFHEDDIVKECLGLAARGKLDDKLAFHAQISRASQSAGVLSASECQNLYQAMSRSTILYTVFLRFLPTILVAFLVHVHYTQMLSRTHPIYHSTLRGGGGRRSAIRMESMADSPLYNDAVGAPTKDESLGEDAATRKSVREAQKAGRSSKGSHGQVGSIKVVGSEGKAATGGHSENIEVLTSLSLSPGPPSYNRYAYYGRPEVLFDLGSFGDGVGSSDSN